MTRTSDNLVYICCRSLTVAEKRVSPDKNWDKQANWLNGSQKKLHFQYIWLRYILEIEHSGLPVFNLTSIKSPKFLIDLSLNFDIRVNNLHPGFENETFFHFHSLEPVAPFHVQQRS